MAFAFANESKPKNYENAENTMRALLDITSDLKIGSKGADVGKLQRFLNNTYFVGRDGSVQRFTDYEGKALKPDNDFGQRTESALKKFLAALESNFDFSSVKAGSSFDSSARQLVSAYLNSEQQVHFSVGLRATTRHNATIEDIHGIAPGTFKIPRDLLTDLSTHPEIIRCAELSGDKAHALGVLRQNASNIDSIVENIVNNKNGRWKAVNVTIPDLRIIAAQAVIMGERYGIDPYLVMLIASYESQFNRFCDTGSGIGLGQITGQSFFAVARNEDTSAHFISAINDSLQAVGKRPVNAPDVKYYRIPRERKDFLLDNSNNIDYICCTILLKCVEQGISISDLTSSERVMERILRAYNGSTHKERYANDISKAYREKIYGPIDFSSALG
jgi:hypothetical protein